MIEQDLKYLGLTDNEISVFLVIIQNGKLSSGAIAKLTKIKRTTVYNVIKTLIDKQLVVEDLGGDSSYIAAAPVENLASMISREEAKLERKKRAVMELLPQLRQLAGSSKYNLPRIQFVDEKNLEQFLYKNASMWNKSIAEHDCVWWGFQDPSFAHFYKDWIDWYWKESAPPNIYLKLLSSESSIEKEMLKKMYNRRLIKFWDKTSLFTGTIWITGDFITLIMTKQRPFYLVQIMDAMLAQNFRSLFKGIWEEIK